jgi:hypothetical protein
LGKVQYPSGDSFPRDGLAAFHVTWEEYQSQPAVLPATPSTATTWSTNNFPVVVWCNSSGFDSTATPIVVRKAHDGTLYYRKKPPVGLVRLLAPNGDGYVVYLADGSTLKLSEKDFVEQYMGLPYQQPVPANADKLSDEDLKKQGFERITPEEYQRRFGKPAPGTDKPAFPTIKNPEKK